MGNTTKDNGACQHETIVSGSKLRITDLRIGNFVTWIDDEEEPEGYEHLTIDGLLSDGTIWVKWRWEDGDGDETDCDLDIVKPIIITKKWLMRFGFTYGVHKMELIKDVCPNVVLKYSLGAMALWIETSREGALLENIEYVHQMQNLYFALTGKELKLDR